MKNWEKINAVNRMQIYIEEHIAESITLYMLANAAGYSPWHCTRIFKELTGKTAFEYIGRLRLSKAAIKLRDESKNSNVKTIFVQVIERPAKKLILKPAIKATDYFQYCEEVGCDVWGVLSSIKKAL